MSENTLVAPYSCKELDQLLRTAELQGEDLLEHRLDKRFFGYFCSYFPEELILAAGLEPLRLLPDSSDSTPAELPTYCCSLARGTLDLGLNGHWRALVGVGFAHTCDTMQCLSGIWGAATHTTTIDLVPPVMLRLEAAEHYYLSELDNLLGQLGRLVQHKIGPGEVSRALNLCVVTRRLATELDQLRPNLPSYLVAAVLRAGQLMPRQEYNLALSGALPTLRNMASLPDARTRILLSGAVLEQDTLFQVIEDLGGRVVADDTCTGYRHYAGVTYNDSANPLQAIFRRYSEMPLCPCKTRGLDERLGYLATLAQERSAQGAIIVIRKYCDPHAWDAVALTEKFQDIGIPSLTLELDGAEVSGQARTRLQAFLEKLMF